MAEVAPPPDNSWLVDMMVTIMHSETWNGPLTAFIQSHCTMFDNFEEENKHEYVTIHNEFKCLVDNLLAAHLLEVDISPEEFEKQLLESGLIEDPRLQQVVNQLMASEDFMTFKTMMVDRHTNMQQMAESNYRELQAPGEDVAAAEAAAMAASLEAAAAAGAPRPLQGGFAAPMAAYTPGGAGVMPAPPMPAAPSGAPHMPPTMQQERAFGAGGGFYGRASLAGGGQAKPSKEKADAVRKALCGALRPR